MMNVDPADHRPSRAEQLLEAAENCAGGCHWQQANALFHQAISCDDTPASRIAYGAYLYRRGHFNHAISTLIPVLDGTDLKAIGIVCHNLAAIYREVGEVDLARRFQWRSTLLRNESDADELLAMANDAIAVGRLEAAKPLVAAAIELNSDEAADCSDGDLIATQGLLQGIMDSPRSGVVTLFWAYQLHRSHRDLKRMGTDLLNMANLFGELKRFRAEKSCLLRAIRCFANVSAHDLLHRAHGRLERHVRMHLLRSFNSELN
ncbi:hypothetical protein [Schlesneria sp.]|uniref:hypothetical protein n=1 Tax=Schlesneria sp. TaxID=2762018 RepID=UPI002EE721B4